MGVQLRKGAYFWAQAIDNTPTIWYVVNDGTQTAADTSTSFGVVPVDSNLQGQGGFQVLDGALDANSGWIEVEFIQTGPVYAFSRGDVVLWFGRRYVIDHFWRPVLFPATIDAVAVLVSLDAPAASVVCVYFGDAAGFPADPRLAAFISTGQNIAIPVTQQGGIAPMAAFTPGTIYMNGPALSPTAFVALGIDGAGNQALMQFAPGPVNGVTPVAADDTGFLVMASVAGNLGFRVGNKVKANNIAYRVLLVMTNGGTFWLALESLTTVGERFIQLESNCSPVSTS
jgi:hypothetical protein